MGELQAIRNDLKNRRYIESYIVVAVSIVILVASAFGVPNQSVMNDLILAALSAITYLTILERREFRTLAEKGDFEGIAAFHASRESIVPLDRTLSVAKSEIILYAVQHYQVVHQCLGLLEEKAKKGCRIKILMMAASRPDGTENPNVEESESHRRYAGLRKQIEASTDSFRKWLGSLDSDTRRNVEIRTYLECPGINCLFIDRDQPDGFVQVELLLYGVHVQEVPHYLVNRKTGGRLFQTHCDSFQRLWDKSLPLAS